MNFRTLIALMAVLVIGPFGCMASIGDSPGEGEFGEGGGPGGGDNTPVPNNDDDPQCLANGDSGEACEVSGDCQAPLVCVGGTCMGPRNPDVRCDPLEGLYCDEGFACAAGVCVGLPATCETTDQCPLGYICSGNACVPERDGEACPTPGPGPDLTGTYTMVSTMHLRDGLPGTVDDILDTFEDLRDIAEGDIDLNLPGAVEFVIGAIVAGVIDQYIPQWAQNFVVAIGDFSDMIDDMTVEGTITLTGQACSGTYRAVEEWEWVVFDFRGSEIRVRPDQLPGVPGGSSLNPDEYSARFDCGTLRFDKHRIKDTMGGLIRFLLDNITEATTGFPRVEDAIVNMVNCQGIAASLDNTVAANCSFCPGVYGVANAACNGVKVSAANKLGQEIDDAAVKMSLIKRSGAVTVGSSGELTDGRWFGSLAGGDFPGEISLVKR